MLHFAARWGLEKLCVILLECPGGVAACEMKSCSGKTPSELAEIAGYLKLSSTIKNFTVSFLRVFIDFSVLTKSFFISFNSK